MENSLKKYAAPTPGRALGRGVLHSKRSWTAGFPKVCQAITILRLLLEQAALGLPKLWQHSASESAFCYQWEHSFSIIFQTQLRHCLQAVPFRANVAFFLACGATSLLCQMLRPTCSSSAMHVPYRAALCEFNHPGFLILWFPVSLTNESFWQEFRGWEMKEFAVFIPLNSLLLGHWLAVATFLQVPFSFS